MTLLAMLQEAAPSGDRSLLVGYVVVAVGAADVLLALMMMLTEKPADRRTRMNLVKVIGLAGVGMIVIGSLVWLGIVGR